MGVATRAGWLVAALALVAPGVAQATISVSVSRDPFATATVTSDADDPIVVTCSPNGVAVNGVDYGGSPGCRIALLVVEGGPGPNPIDLRGWGGGVSDGSSIFCGVRVTAGAGDDTVIARGCQGSTIDGGPGSDRLVGLGTETYVLGPAVGEELDTVVEAGRARCRPGFPELDVEGDVRGGPTADWDAIDASGAGGPVVLDAAAPDGVLGTTPGRTIRLERTGDGPAAIERAVGGDGNDLLTGFCLGDGREGDDRLVGTRRGDLLIGGPGEDELAGAGGDDLLVGQRGADRLAGAGGRDVLDGGAGADRLAGGPGDDTYLVGRGSGDDAVEEGARAGRDLLVLALPRRLPASVDLGAPRTARWRGGGVAAPPGAFEAVIGGAGDDVLRGSADDDVLWSGGGSDLLAGGPGDDRYLVRPTATLPERALGLRAGATTLASLGLPARVDGLTSCDCSRLGLPVTATIDERPGEGFDTVDLSGDRTGARGDAAVRLDLGQPRWLAPEGGVRIRTGTLGGGAWLEGALGGFGRDELRGNAADNRLEGGGGRDVLIGRGGLDTCPDAPRRVSRERDRIRRCERLGEADPRRSPLAMVVGRLP